MEPMRNRTLTVTLVCVVALCLGSSALVRQPIDRLRSGAELRDVLFIPSPKLLKSLSLGYNGLLADIYWTRAVQYFGSRHRQGEMDYKLLSPLLNITTELDPHLLVAYQFGSIFLSQAPPQGAGDPDAAAALVERGIKANPDNWRLYLNLGFIDYQQRKDYAAAQDAFERGSKVKNAHPALKVLAAEMAEHRNDTATARYLWTALYENTEDKILRENAEEHLTALQVEDEITRLEQVIEAYRQRMGRFPSSWLELNEAGYISGIPRDPTGAALRLADGHVFVQDATKIPFLGKGLPPGQQPAPRPGIQ